MAATRSLVRAEIRRRQAHRAAHAVVSVIPALAEARLQPPSATTASGSASSEALAPSLGLASPPATPATPAATSASPSESVDAFLQWSVRQLLNHRHPYLALEVRSQRLTRRMRNFFFTELLYRSTAFILIECDRPYVCCSTSIDAPVLMILSLGILLRAAPTHSTDHRSSRQALPLASAASSSLPLWQSTACFRCGGGRDGRSLCSALLFSFPFVS